MMQTIRRKAGGNMPNGTEIVRDAIWQFQRVQRCMIVAKEEHAARTYAELKADYLSLKAILNVAGVNMTDIDVIKE